MEIDVHSPDTYAIGVPYEQFRWLRANAPVYWHGEPNGRGFWAITKHQDIVAISRDPHTFSSARGGTFIYDPLPDDLVVMQMVMLNMDPPQHTRFRNIIKTAFLPKILVGLEGKIRAAVNRIMDSIADKNECDFVHEVAAELPLTVIADMLSVPQEDREKVFGWSTLMVSYDDPEFQTNSGEGLAAAMEMWAYAGELGQKRFENPGNDLISLLMKGVTDGGLSAMEFASFFMMLIVAGNETTRNAISAGMLALIEYPAEMARLRVHPELMPSAVEEILRWSPPMIAFRRTAMRDTEIRGVKIKDNDKVVLFYPSANRDEEVFANPDVFDIARTPNDHLTFGVGQHICLGLNLARMEIRVMFEELLSRFTDFELSAPPRRLRSNFTNTIKSMPLRFRRATSSRLAQAL